MTENGDAINGDLAARAVMDTNSMEWTASPSGTVWRKRVHLVGAPESGQVTSIVRYEPDASFPIHDHPEGEEILVLKGWEARGPQARGQTTRRMKTSRMACACQSELES